MGLKRLEAVVDLVPVDYIPPGRQVFGATIVVLEIVGMFPDVVAEDGEQSLGDGVVLIGGAENLDFATGFAGQPDPAAAELLDSSFVEFGLEIFEVAERLFDDVGDRAAGIAAALRLHDLP